MKKVPTYSTGILPDRLEGRYLFFTLDLHHNHKLPYVIVQFSETIFSTAGKACPPSCYDACECCGKPAKNTRTRHEVLIS